MRKVWSVFDGRRSITSKGEIRMKMKKGIEYSQKSWNPYTGCTMEGCAVGKNCWAYKMSLRQAGRNGYDKDNPFQPTEHPNRMEQPLNRKKPTIYNVSFMGDIAHVKKNWLLIMIQVIKYCPQHRFIFLTKHPEKLMMLNVKFPDNCIVGVTMNKEIDIWRISELVHHIDAKWKWLSVEPMYGRLNISLDGIDWLVIGAQTNPDLQPDVDWVMELLHNATEKNTPTFCKPNLTVIESKYLMELPEVLRLKP